jgi:pilus assembly protein Flp/PilA
LLEGVPSGPEGKGQWFDSGALETALQAIRRRESDDDAVEKAPINFFRAPHGPMRSRKTSEDTMKSLAKKMQRFLVSEDGPTAVEYAVMLALIIIVCLTAINAIGTNANTTFTNVGNSLAS